MQTTNEHTTQASEVLKGFDKLNILAPALQARHDNDFEVLAYLIQMALDKSTNYPVKFGLIFAVCDAIDSMEAV